MEVNMAKYAYRVPNGTENDRVDASDLPLHGNGTFYCTTPDCRARMYVRSPQKQRACFVSYNISEHTGGILCHIKDLFKPDDYCENLFSLDNFFTNLLTKQDRDSSPHHGSGGKGSNSKIAINTLKMLYLMCVQYREGGSYNNYPIDDILVDKYNFDKYRENGIIGNRIVACTFWKYDPNTNCIFMNCPDERLYLPGEEHKILKIHVTDDKMFEKCANKLKDKTHLHISVIGANWIPSNDNNCLAECEVVSVGKQICKGD